MQSQQTHREQREAGGEQTVGEGPEHRGRRIAAHSPAAPQQRPSELLSQWRRRRLPIAQPIKGATAWMLQLSTDRCDESDAKCDAAVAAGRGEPIEKVEEKTSPIGRKIEKSNKHFKQMSDELLKLCDGMKHLLLCLSSSSGQFACNLVLFFFFLQSRRSISE